MGSLPSPMSIPLPRRQILRWGGWYLLANAFMLALLGLSYLSGAPDGLLACLFLGLMLPVHFFELALIASPLALLPALLFRRRWALGWGVFAYALAVGVVLADIQVFELYRFHLNRMVWTLVTSGVAHEVIPVSVRTWSRVAVVFAGVLLVEGAAAWGIWRLVNRRHALHGRAVAVSVCLAVVSANLWHAGADAYQYTPITRQMLTFPWVRAMTSASFFESIGFRPSENRPAHTVHRAASSLAYPLADIDCQTVESPLNILIIAIEGWRYDMLSSEVTPNIARFAESSSRWHQHLSSGNTTRYGIFGLMYGLDGTYWDAFVAEERGPILVDEARRRGYDMAVFRSAALTWPEFDRTVFSAVRERVPHRTAGEYAFERDQRINELFLASLDELAEPFLGFVFYDAPHSFEYPPQREAPFQPIWPPMPPTGQISVGAGDYLDLDREFDPAPLMNRYKNSLLFVDDLVGEILDTVSSRGLLESTVVVVTGDHGTELNESRRGYWGHNSNMTRYQTGVPLVIRWPGREQEEYRHDSSHVDLAPTLIREVYGCRAPYARYSNGRSLFDASARDYRVATSYNQIGIVDGESTIVVHDIGGLAVYDRQMGELAAPPRLELIQAVLDDMARFRAQ